MDNLAIIIVNYNTQKDTRECLASLSKVDFKGASYKIIVVDNASKEPLHLAKSLLDNNTEIIRSESNLGFTGGNNLGISYAIKKYQSEFFLLLNSDTTVADNFYQALKKTLQAHSQAAIVSPKIYFYPGNEYHLQSYTKKERGKILWFAGGSIDWQHLSSFHRGVDELDRGQFDHETEIDFATGCCMLFKRELVERIGIFDKRFFLYSEDVDYCLRAKRAGYKIIFSPLSVIWHKNSGSSEGVGSKVQTYYQTRNKLLLALKHDFWSHKLAIFLITMQIITNGSSTEKQALFDLIFRRLGKQQII
ncbi:MAG: glycosyltransferase family 2 protein [Patescibacteria group bacterium]